ncbi:hypothetical protein TcasGA2_TC031137 [Tribolium castaneum]|uniref:Uncharacterized protein n=1 Tax=Tribolium castaneum TaxID=7070 RepID=A0A139WI50_TRICA|nr:hypothetical protein TcasGA2_TC031137 [Tribolium castaneum]
MRIVDIFEAAGAGYKALEVALGNGMEVKMITKFKKKKKKGLVVTITNHWKMIIVVMFSSNPVFKLWNFWTII